MWNGETRSAAPVRQFMRRLGLQILISGTAMAAIHGGMQVMPDARAFFGSAEPAVNDKPAGAITIAAAKADRITLPAVAAPTVVMAEMLPLPRPAPDRATSKENAKGVERFDHCVPACPSRDPLLRRTETADPRAQPEAWAFESEDSALSDGGEVEASSSASGSAPKRLLSAAGRGARAAWNRVEALLPL